MATRQELNAILAKTQEAARQAESAMLERASALSQAQADLEDAEEAVKAAEAALAKHSANVSQGLGQVLQRIAPPPASTPAEPVEEAPEEGEVGAEPADAAEAELEPEPAPQGEPWYNRGLIGWLTGR